MAKQAITQRSFTLGQPREEFLDAADIDILDNSLRLAENVRIKASRTLAQRHGSNFLKYQTASARIFEIRPADGLVYALEINTLGRVRVLDEDAGIIWTGATSSITDDELSHLWVENFADRTVIGTSDRLLMLTYSGGTFGITSFAFDAAPGDELAQPYWLFASGITMTPSARTGSITLTASSAFFTTGYVGLRVRYGQREILITAYTSSTQVTGTVQSQLPPTYRLTLSSAVGFKVNDTVIGQTTDFKGLIVAVSGSDIDVITQEFFDGPDISEKLSAPSGTATVSVKTEISPAASPIWDEPLISSVRGYPRSGAVASGRLIFCDFASAPDVIAASSARAITDWRVGDEDDDAIARAVGNNRPRFMHVVNASDLLLFADQGCYLVALRDGTPLTPSTFVPIAFDARGSSTARPAKVDDAVVFIEASGSSIAAATLTGDYYSKWAVRTISTFHDQLFDGPLSLCGPPTNCVLDDKYLFVVNSDGTMTVMSWVDGFSADNVGFVTWSTDGDYVSATPIFGGYWFQTRRGLGDPASETIIVEKLSATSMMDCEFDATGAIETVFNKTVMHVAGTGWYAGTYEITSGAVPEVSELPDDARVGFNFVSRVMVWPKILVQHPKAGILQARVIRAAFSVLDTDVVDIRANSITQRFGGYAFGDDQSEPAPARTQSHRISIVGRRDHPEIEISKPLPGRMQILSVTQEVSL